MQKRGSKTSLYAASLAAILERAIPEETTVILVEEENYMKQYVPIVVEWPGYLLYPKMTDQFIAATATRVKNNYTSDRLS